MKHVNKYSFYIKILAATSACLALLITTPSYAANIIESVDFQRGADGRALIYINTNGSLAAKTKKRAGSLELTFSNTILPGSLASRYNVTDFATKVKQFAFEQKNNNLDLSIAIKGDYDFLVHQVNNRYTVEVYKPARPVIKKVKRSYTGKNINMTFQDIDVRSALQIIADVSGFNIVAGDSVQGTITINLNNTPWDQALDVILTTKGLGKRKNGNIIYVAPIDQLNEHEKKALEAEQTKRKLNPILTELISVNYAKAADLARLIEDSSKNTGGSNEKSFSSNQESLLSDRGSITADTRTNSLLVMETADKIQQIRSLVEELDIPVAQVLIESRIVIATNDFSRELGVRLGATGVNTSSNGIATLSGSAAANNSILSGFTNTGTPISAPNLADRLAVNLPVSGSAGRIGMSLLGSDYLLDLELSALQAEGRGEIVSNPRVIASNQHEAVIEQGIEIPYLSVSQKGTSVLFKKATLRLAVTPLITPDNRVTLDLEVFKDNIGQQVPSGQGGFVPSIDTRQLKTQVITDDGQTVVLGGIYETTNNDTVSKVPFLGDIPVLGGLFRTKKNTDAKTELLIFITPQVIEERINLDL